MRGDHICNLSMLCEDAAGVYSNPHLAEAYVVLLPR